MFPNPVPRSCHQDLLNGIYSTNLYRSEIKDTAPAFFACHDFYFWYNVRDFSRQPLSPAIRKFSFFLLLAHKRDYNSIKVLLDAFKNEVTFS